MPEAISFLQFAGFTAALFLVLAIFVVWYCRRYKHIYLWGNPGSGKSACKPEDIYGASWTNYDV